MKYFDKGLPFASVLAPSGIGAAWYEIALAVRNRVAHPSDNARSKFINAARSYKNVNTLRPGYVAGEFLVEGAKVPTFDPTHLGKTVFEAMAASMEALADRLMA